MLVCVFFAQFCTRDRGCSVHPAFPAPSDFKARKFTQTSGASRRENADVHFENSSTSSSRRTPGHITTGLGCCAKAGEQLFPKRPPRRMGPGVRRDDEDGELHAVLVRRGFRASDTHHFHRKLLMGFAECSIHPATSTSERLRIGSP